MCDELIGEVIAAVRPARQNGHGAASDLLVGRREDVTRWVKGGLSIVKIEVLLTRSGTTVPYRTLHRFAAEECGFRARGTSMRVLDGDPGVECQIDFAQMGFITDTESGRRRKVHALIFTAVMSRHMFVHLSYSQTLAEVIAGCEAACVFFGGVFKVLMPENVPRNIFGVMYPPRICVPASGPDAVAFYDSRLLGPGELASRPHNRH